MVLKNSQLMVISCGLALQAFILVLLNTYVAKVAGANVIWVAFQAWAVYFLTGCDVKGGLKVLIGYATGIAASVAIVELMGVPGIKDIPSLGGVNLVMATAVFLVVIPAIFFSEKLNNLVPALFIGSGAFFALMGSADIAELNKTGWALYGAVTQAELVYCAFGLTFGWITIFWQGKYKASLNK